VTLAFLYAVRHKELEIVKFMMESFDKQILLKQSLGDGRNSLILAIENKDHLMIDYLIENNIPEVKSLNKMTPMMYAVKRNLIELAKTFILKGHEIFEMDFEGNDIFVYAIEKGLNFSKFIQRE
jgi:ankyrin repeat protein